MPQDAMVTNPITRPSPDGERWGQEFEAQGSSLGPPPAVPAPHRVLLPVRLPLHLSPVLTSQHSASRYPAQLDGSSDRQGLWECPLLTIQGSNELLIHCDVCNLLLEIPMICELVHSCRLRGPAAILFKTRDTCSDSIAKLFRVCFFFCGVSHNYRAIRCKMGYRTDVPVRN